MYRNYRLCLMKKNIVTSLDKFIAMSVYLPVYNDRINVGLNDTLIESFFLVDGTVTVLCHSVS